MSLWLNRGSNSGPLSKRANTLITELSRHTVISPTTFHLKPTSVTHFPGPFKFVHEFPVGEIHEFPIFFHLNHLYTVGYLCWEPNVIGEKLWLDRGSNPEIFAGPANTLPLSYRGT